MYTYYYPFRKYSSALLNEVVANHMAFNPFNSQPSTNVKAFADRYELELNLPEIDPKQIKINVKDSILVIEYTAPNTEHKEDFTWIRREFNPEQSFRREFALPEDADTNKLSAKYSGNILTLTIMKQVKEEPKNVDIEII
ncbi:MAG: hypothetical protein OHK0017_01830 [Patescibacteria group bacterium]